MAESGVKFYLSGSVPQAPHKACLGIMQLMPAGVVMEVSFPAPDGRPGVAKATYTKTGPWVESGQAAPTVV
jgi:hypothetical protein